MMGRYGRCDMNFVRGKDTEAMGSKVLKDAVSRGFCGFGPILC